jgi:hypothetical protein
MTQDATPQTDTLPAPKPAVSHVAQTISVDPRPHEPVSDAGVPHPAHRAG